MHFTLCHLCGSVLFSSLILEEVERMSVCELEVDAVAADVLNRLEIESMDKTKFCVFSEYICDCGSKLSIFLF